MKVDEDKELRPKCPHCERTLERLVKVKHGEYEQHNVYCCPHCHKILGVGVSRH
jgi:hypothetical protein